MIGGLPADYFTESNGELHLDATTAEEITWEIVESTITINETTYAIDKQKLLCTVKAEIIKKHPSTREYGHTNVPTKQYYINTVTHN